ncbi:hypothetical protein [Acidithrix sp. C25]|uniref:hypothetical protein n=1 Tax=Acidithrix sp. C25 TaxID=1671482 RepID=UPI00191B9DA6|nr:hypothetical protein [Acidithrix sp. C25]CAG4922975.1 unnamed protein product [Acidithrix sp. C25]
MSVGYYNSIWSGEDGGPSRLGIANHSGDLGLIGGRKNVEVTSRFVPLATMVVTRDTGEIYLLRHGSGDNAKCFVEKIDPISLEPIVTSLELEGGPTWPGSIAVHSNGSIYVVFGNHISRLSSELVLLASKELPRVKPYNGLVILEDGTIATKDFAGSRPGNVLEKSEQMPSHLVVLEPDSLEMLDVIELSEPSIARISSVANDIYVAGDRTLMRVRFRGKLELDSEFLPLYKTTESQGSAWDVVVGDSSAWFLDNGDDSYRYNGTLIGVGTLSSEVRLFRVDLVSGQVTSGRISDLSKGVVANPPLVDFERRIAVGYDSGNGIVTAFDFDDLGNMTQRWSRSQNHGGHMVYLRDEGLVVSDDYDLERNIAQMVILEIESGDEVVRVDTGSPVQSVLFPAVGFNHDLYLCTFSTISRIAFCD